MSLFLSFLIDTIIFVLFPWLTWRLLRRSIPLAVLPILFGLLIAALGWKKTGWIEPSFLGHQFGFIGVLLLAFTAGLEMHSTTDNVSSDLSVPSKRSSITRLIGSAINALLLPFIAGTISASLYFNKLPGWTTEGNATNMLGSMSIGLCLAVSALPVLIGIVRELGKEHRPLGNLAIKLAVIDDIVLWIGLATLLIFANSTATSAAWGEEEALALSLLAIILTFSKIIKVRNRHPSKLLAWLFASLFLSIASWSTYELGLHALLGAYFAGAIFPSKLSQRLPVERIGLIALFILAPLFFGHSGLRINSEAVNMTSLFAAVGLLLLSLVTKITAIILFPPSPDLSRRETVAIGALLQCKGLMEIVAATILHDQGLLSEYAYAGLITLAILSTAITGPLFKFCFRQEKIT